MKQEITSRYSCKRRKDCVTIFAIVMFLLIVSFELYLMFWLPVQLRRENAMQRHVARQRLTELADHLRSMSRPRNKTSLEKGEMELIRSALDVMAIYIRENQERLSGRQIRELDAMLKRTAGIVNGWHEGNRYNIKREAFDPTPILKALEARLDALDKTAASPK